MINKKIKSALKDGLRPILCVGEPLATRQKGVPAARAHIKNQLKKDLAGVAGVGARASVIIAYEPLWAIGTGRNDKPEDAVEMARFIKSAGSFPLVSLFLYGGSVNSKNIADYVQYKEIDGALVGGASLRATEFKKMIKKITQ
jgi:triosephosphate isomerase